MRKGDAKATRLSAAEADASQSVVSLNQDQPWISLFVRLSAPGSLYLV